MPVSVALGDQTVRHKIDMREEPPIDGAFISVGQFELIEDQKVAVTLSTEGAGGFVHADAVQVIVVE